MIKANTLVLATLLLASFSVNADVATHAAAPAAKPAAAAAGSTTGSKDSGAQVASVTEEEELSPLEEVKAEPAAGATSEAE